MSKKKNKQNNPEAVAQQPTEQNTDVNGEVVKEGFFKRHFNSVKKKISDHKTIVAGAVGGAVAAAATAAGLYLYGMTEIDDTNLEETEGGEEDESPQDE